VNDPDFPTSPAPVLSPEEVKLLGQLRANPVMAGRFSQIMDRFEQEIANGGDANEAEMMAAA